MRKFLALVMVAAMMATFASVAFAEDTVVATYTFDEGKADAGLTENGENFTYADGTVTLGAESYFTSDVDLKGAESVTVTMKVKPTGSTAWPIEITSEESHAYPTEHYLGVLLNADLTAERYANPAEKNARPGNVVVSGIGTDMVEIQIVWGADNGTVVYVNGEEKGTFAQPDGYDLTIANCIGENPVVQIGKANWGEYSDGLVIDEVTIAATYAADGAEDGETASQTGFATIALAIAAIGSGAYIVSKKH